MRLGIYLRVRLLWPQHQVLANVARKKGPVKGHPHIERPLHESLRKGHTDSAASVERSGYIGASAVAAGEPLLAADLQMRDLARIL